MPKYQVRLSTICVLTVLIVQSLTSFPVRAYAYQRGLCAVAVTTDNFTTCDSGDSKSAIEVALIGDSHTRSWFGPASLLAKKYGWHLTVVSKSACPPMEPGLIPSHLPSQTCISWNKSLQSYLKSQKPFNLVINMNSTLVTGGNPAFGAAFAGMAREITRTGAQLLVIHDNPKPASGFLNCIAAHKVAAANACSRPRTDALQPADPMGVAARNIPGVKLVDFTNSYCDATKCPPIIDGIVVYKDHSHISFNWAVHMLPVLDAAIPEKFKH